MFLRHEGFLGSIGAWIRNVEATEGGKAGQDGQEPGETEKMVQE
jgi:hypothetical protein